MKQSYGDTKLATHVVKELLALSCNFFKLLSNNSDITMMTPDNIGISIGPSVLLSPKIRNDPNEFMNNKAPSILSFCIQYSDQIFYNDSVSTTITS